MSHIYSTYYSLFFYQFVVVSKKSISYSMGSFTKNERWCYAQFHVCQNLKRSVLSQPSLKKNPEYLQCLVTDCKCHNFLSSSKQQFHKIEMKQSTICCCVFSSKFEMFSKVSQQQRKHDANLSRYTECGNQRDTCIVLLTRTPLAKS